MAVDFAALSLVTAPGVRRIFELIVSNKSIRLGDLIKRVPGIDLEQTKQTLQALKERDLIKEAGSEVEEFNTYYVTADGLEASRKAGF